MIEIPLSGKECAKWWYVEVSFLGYYRTYQH